MPLPTLSWEGTARERVERRMVLHCVQPWAGVAVQLGVEAVMRVSPVGSAGSERGTVEGERATATPPGRL